MATPIMIQSNLVDHVIDIADSSSGSNPPMLDAWPAKGGGLRLIGQPIPLADNQTWEILPDPAGSSHHIIKNPATGRCIDISGNSTAKGAALDAWPEKQRDNQNQLWDLLPDPFGSGYFFIQNPQTGFVIEIEDASLESGAHLVINPRRLFGNRFQLWTGMADGGATAENLPLLTMAEARYQVLIGSGQYVLQPPTQAQSFTEVTVILDIIEELVFGSQSSQGTEFITDASPGFSVQINGYPPYPPPNYNPQPGQSKYKWDAHWFQLILVMQNNSLALIENIWPPNGGVPGMPTSSVATSASLLELPNATIPAGTRVVLTLNFDGNAFLTGISGKVFNGSGTAIGTPIDFSAIGKPTWTTGIPPALTGPALQESQLAPLASFQVVVVGHPSGRTHFTAGQGTITVAATPSFYARENWPPDPEATGTGETSNVFYGPMQGGDNPYPLITQSFGVPSPNITARNVPYSFSGTGLYPNSRLDAKANFGNPGGKAVAAVIEEFSPTAASDGSFSLTVVPEEPYSFTDAATLEVLVSDAYGNWASCECLILQWPKNSTHSSGTSEQYK